MPSPFQVRAAHLLRHASGIVSHFLCNMFMVLYCHPNRSCTVDSLAGAAPVYTYLTDAAAAEEQEVTLV